MANNSLPYRVLTLDRGNFPSADAVKVSNADDVWQEDVPEKGKLSGGQTETRNERMNDTTSAAAEPAAFHRSPRSGMIACSTCGVRMAEQLHSVGDRVPTGVGAA